MFSGTDPHQNTLLLGQKIILTYPLVICYIAIENGPVEIVDLPIEHGGSFHSFL
jgi:hypothetical protein